eukprot:688588-Rhodomonas_salina.1
MAPPSSACDTQWLPCLGTACDPKEMSGPRGIEWPVGTYWSAGLIHIFLVTSLVDAGLQVGPVIPSSPGQTILAKRSAWGMV